MTSVQPRIDIPMGDRKIAQLISSPTSETHQALEDFSQSVTGPVVHQDPEDSSVLILTFQTTEPTIQEPN